MRTADTITIFVPPAMAEQMQQIQKRENRTQSQLLRQAWREYFESHYGSYTPTKDEVAGIRQGRAQISRGQYRPLQELRGDLDNSHRKSRGKTAQKSPR